MKSTGSPPPSDQDILAYNQLYSFDEVAELVAQENQDSLSAIRRTLAQAIIIGEVVPEGPKQVFYGEDPQQVDSVSA